MVAYLPSVVDILWFQLPCRISYTNIYATASLEVRREVQQGITSDASAIWRLKSTNQIGSDCWPIFLKIKIILYLVFFSDFCHSNVMCLRAELHSWDHPVVACWGCHVCSNILKTESFMCFLSACDILQVIDDCWKGLSSPSPHSRLTKSRTYSREWQEGVFQCLIPPHCFSALFICHWSNLPCSCVCLCLVYLLVLSTNIVLLNLYFLYQPSG